MSLPDRRLALAGARSFLFVPGNRPERFAKALASGADAVILDLEDSVPLAEKAAARDGIAQAWSSLAARSVPLLVRVNPEGSAAHDADLDLLAALRPDALMLPKAESAAGLARLQDRLADGGGALPVVPLIESALGYRQLDAIAQAPGVLRLAVGHLDFLSDTGIACDADESELAPLRFAVAIATRLAQLAPAVDGVTVQVGDAQALRRDTLRARRFGFGAKLCIHPAQVAGVHEAFAPSGAELEWARRVVEADAAADGRAVQLDGRMVDRPVVLLAQRLLARAAR